MMLLKFDGLPGKSSAFLDYLHYYFLCEKSADTQNLENSQIQTCRAFSQEN